MNPEWLPIPTEQIADMSEHIDFDKWSDLIEFVRAVEMLTRFRAGLPATID